MTAVRALVSDLDGTLLCTEELYQSATNQVLARWDKTFPDEVRQRVIGKPELVGAQIIVDGMELPLTAQGFLDERDKYLKALMVDAQPKPGAIRVLQHFKALGLPVALATSSYREYLDLKRQKNSALFDCVDCVVCGDDPRVKKGKPAPDIYLTAAQELGVDPQYCLTFEDAPPGVESAVTAGMRVVAVPDVIQDRTQFAKAEKILTSLEDFNPEYFGLAPMAPKP